MFPSSRTEWWLWGGAVAGWVGSGAAAHAGALTWPAAVFLTGVTAAPLLIWSTFVRDDDE